MQSRVKSLCCQLVLVCTPVVAFAADVKLHGARRSKNPSKIYAQFQTPNALTDCDVEYPTTAPPCAAAAVSPPWSVVVYDSAGNPTADPVTAARDEIGYLQANGVVTLTLLNPIPADFSRVDVTYTKPKAPYATIPGTSAPAKHLITAAKTKDDSDVYISGTFAPGEGTSPSYTIDSKGKFVIRSFGKTGATTVSATGDVNTDNKKTADPDSFHWAIPLQYVSPKPYTLQWSTVGMELDKKGNAVNIVSAPSATASLSHLFTEFDPKANLSKLIATVGLDLTAGVEFGDNLRNDFAVVNKSTRGEGPFFRGLGGATAYLVVPNVWHLSKVAVTSSYVARIPTSDELFLETRHVKNPVPLLTSQTRQYVQNSVSFMFTDYLGFQVKHQYGCLPPAFKFVDNSGSIGLVLAFKETGAPK